MDKQCSKCKAIKPITEFNRDNRFGYRSECKKCRYRNLEWEKQSRIKNATKIKLLRQRYNSSVKGNFMLIKGEAVKRKIPFNLTLADYTKLWDKSCYYCGITVKTRGIDRIDNTKGYFSDNIVRCCQKCNSRKRTKTIDKFLN